MYNKFATRFNRIAQLLFTSDISEEELSIAKKAIDIFERAESDFQDWVNSIEKNLDVFKNYHGKEKSLVVISEVFEDTMEKQKQKYERVITSIKQGIELLNNIQDVEMQDMITNVTKASEEFTEIYNEMTDMQLKIGEAGFIQEFKDISQKIIDGYEPLLDVIARIRDYMLKNILGEQQLS